MNDQLLNIRQLGRQDYQPIWQQMKHYTDTRDEQSPDQLWLLEHFPVYTQGQKGQPEHILNPGNIPVIQVDRGGQVTYHGPGQLIVYILVDIRRLKLGVRTLVRRIEASVIALLADYGIIGEGRCDAPGVYVNNAKICSLGLRIRRGCSYHGLSFNVDMDLTPFQQINPCGLPNLQITQLKDLGGPVDFASITPALVAYLQQQLYGDLDDN